MKADALKEICTMKHTRTILAVLLLVPLTALHAADSSETGAKSATRAKPKVAQQRAEFGYRPDGMKMWDPWFVEHDGQVHLFHLQRLSGGSKRTAAEADHIGHAVSRDFIHWTEQPLTVGPGEKGGMEDMQPWTGCARLRRRNDSSCFSISNSR